MNYLKFRSRHRRCSVRKGVLRNFAKFTGKHLCQSLFFNKVAALRLATLLIKETLAQVFSCEFCEISNNTFFTEYSGRLLLKGINLNLMISKFVVLCRNFDFHELLVRLYDRQINVLCKPKFCYMNKDFFT